MRVKARRYCGEIDQMVSLDLIIYKVYHDRYRFIFEGCQHRGNGCENKNGGCVVGCKKRMRIGKPRYEPSYNIVPLPKIIRRKEDRQFS